MSATETKPIADMATQSILELFSKRVGSTDAYAAMRDLCWKLRTETRQAKPPTSLSLIWRKLGAEVVEGDLPNPGHLEVQSRGFRIHVQSGWSWQRRRFTIAHEIGHILLLRTLADEPEAIRALLAGHEWSEAERLCNWAAAELLFPSEQWPDLALDSISASTLKDLADRFKASSAAVTVRLVQMQPEFHITLWRYHARNSREEPAWRIMNSYAADSRVRFPPGVSSRHVDPDIVRRAGEMGEAFSREITLRLRAGLEVQGTAKALTSAGDEMYGTLPWITVDQPIERLSRFPIVTLVLCQARGKTVASSASSFGQLALPLREEIR